MARSIPLQMLNSLRSGVTTFCTLIKITPTQPGFPTFGLTSLDTDVVYDDGTGDGPIKYVAAIGYEPSTLQNASDMTVSGGEAKSLMPLFDIPVNEKDIVAGAYDFANFISYQIDYNDLTPGRHIIVQSGTLGQNVITDNGLSFTSELRGLTQPLKQSVTEKFSLSCRAPFGSMAGDKGVIFPCNFDASVLWQSGAVVGVGVENTRTFTTAGLSPPYGGTPGLIHWLTGDNAGRFDEVEVFEDDAGVQTLALTFGSMFPIQSDDTFEFRDDCPKTPTACKARDNWQNYRGEPTIPVADNGAMAVGLIPSSAEGTVDEGDTTTTTESDPTYVRLVKQRDFFDIQAAEAYNGNIFTLSSGGVSVAKYDAKDYSYKSAVHVLDTAAEVVGFTRIGDVFYTAGCQFDQNAVRVPQGAIDDADAGQLTKYNAGSGNPQSVCVLDDYVWVTNTYAPKGLKQLDPITMSVIKTISSGALTSGGSGPSGLATDGKYLYSSVRLTSSSLLVCVDPTSGDEIWNVETQRYTCDVIVVNRKVWSLGVDYLMVNNAADGAELKAIPTRIVGDVTLQDGIRECNTTPRPRNIWYDGEYIYVAAFNNGIACTYVFHPNTMAQVKTLVYEGFDSWIVGKNGDDLIDAYGYVLREETT